MFIFLLICLDGDFTFFQSKRREPVCITTSPVKGSTGADRTIKPGFTSAVKSDQAKPGSGFQTQSVH
jgi:hypothetical protein